MLLLKFCFSPPPKKKKFRQAGVRVRVRVRSQVANLTVSEMFQAAFTFNKHVLDFACHTPSYFLFCKAHK